MGKQGLGGRAREGWKGQEEEEEEEVRGVISVTWQKMQIWG
jgi:hypothetical protein